jgi:nitrous oxidase accessory protein NosD
MARKVINKKGFLIIAMTPEEAIDKCKFGFHNYATHETILVNDDSNDILNNENYVYYIAVLNRLFSKSSTRKWLNSESTIRFDEDTLYEEKYYNYYSKILRI